MLNTHFQLLIAFTHTSSWRGSKAREQSFFAGMECEKPRDLYSETCLYWNRTEQVIFVFQDVSV